MISNMKIVLSIVFSFMACYLLAQKGVGISGKIIDNVDSSGIANKKVFIVFDSSALGFVPTLHKMLITAPDGSYSIFAPDIPDSLIPLEVMVYTFDCEYYRNGYILTFNQNNVIATDVNIDICNGMPQNPPHVLLSDIPDGSCESYQHVSVNDSVRRHFLFENYQWKYNGTLLGNNSDYDIFLQQSVNDFELTLYYSDSITGFFYDSLVFHKEYDIPDTAFFTIGGTVMHDGIPIAETTASLYFKINQEFIAYDTSAFNQYGYYYFHHMPTCNYTVRIINAVDTVNHTFLPTYFNHVPHWYQADIVHLSHDVFDQNIDILCQPELNGIGQINGQIAQSAGNNYEVFLYNTALEVIKYTPTSINGDFSFANLPFGDYYLYSEKMGELSMIGYVSLSASDPVADVVLTPTTGVADPETGNIVLYPVPASNELTILGHTTDEPCLIIDAEGRIISSQQCIEGKLNVSEIANGYYILYTKSKSGEYLHAPFLISR